VILTRSPLGTFKASSKDPPFDLHVLSTPPAFILSQNQTLHKKLVLIHKVLLESIFYVPTGVFASLIPDLSEDSSNTKPALKPLNFSPWTWFPAKPETALKTRVKQLLESPHAAYILAFSSPIHTWQACYSLQAQIQHFKRSFSAATKKPTTPCRIPAKAADSRRSLARLVPVGMSILPSSISPATPFHSFFAFFPLFPSPNPSPYPRNPLIHKPKPDQHPKIIFIKYSSEYLQFHRRYRPYIISLKSTLNTAKYAVALSATEDEIKLTFFDFSQHHEHRRLKSRSHVDKTWSNDGGQALEFDKVKLQADEQAFQSKNPCFPSPHVCV
jgi:hypothetical protein